MWCSSCKAVSAADANFCGQCGTPLVHTCLSCGRDVSLIARFCSFCGASVSRAQESLQRDPERRRLTVMFCDLVGSTSLSARLDPEDFGTILRRYHQICSEAIRGFDGHVAQYLGDGVLAYFGYPRAHEDSASRAVHGGLAILEAMEGFNAELQVARGVKISVRIGVHTGLVVVGGVGGDGRREQLALGETPNVAARIQALAEPGRMLVSASTHELVRGSMCAEDLGPHRLKGIEEPVRLFRIVDLDETSTSSRRLQQQRLPFVGRAEDVRRLQRSWEDAREGRGQVVLLSGEAGIGKSRLIETLRERLAQDPDNLRLTLNGSALHQQSALHPFTDQLQRALRLDRASNPAEKLAVLERALASFGGALQEALPVFASLLSLPAPEAPGPAPAPSPQKQRERIQEALAAWILGQAAGRATLLVCEDLHWFDPSSLDVLKQLLEGIGGSRILVVLSFRPGFQPGWSSDPSWVRLDLQRLTQEETEDLILRLADGRVLPSEMMRQLVVKTDGVPLFVEELTRTVIDSAKLLAADDRFLLAGPLPPMEIPGSLHDSLMARLDRLSTARTVLQIAAMLGREFSPELLRAVAPVDAETLEQDLARLVAAGLLFKGGGRQQSARYAFKHALIRDAAYESMLRTKRQRYHLKIAEILEGAPAPGAGQVAVEEVGRIALLAHHWSRAVDPQQCEPALALKAAGYLREAGRRELALIAYQEACGRFQEALDLLARVPECRGRAEAELTLRILLGSAFKATLGWGAPEVKAALDRAYVLCTELGDRAELPQVLIGLWSFHHCRAEYHRAEELARECLDLTRRRQDSEGLAEALSALSNTLFFLGNLPGALEHGLQAVAAFDPERHEAHVLRFGQDARMIALQYVIWSLMLMGQAKEALAVHEHMAAVLEEQPHPVSLVIGLLTSLELHMRYEDAPAVLAAADRMTEISREMGAGNYELTGVIFRQRVMAASGEGSELAEGLRQNLSTLFEMTGGVAVAYGASCFTELLWRAGMDREALEVVEDGLAKACRYQELAYEADLHWLRGEILIGLARRDAGPADAAGRRSDAEAALRDAFELAARRRQVYFAQRAARSLEALLLESGRAAEAGEVMERFRRLAAATRAQVRRILASCGGLASLPRASSLRLAPSHLELAS